MNRRNFIKQTTIATLGSFSSLDILGSSIEQEIENVSLERRKVPPRAISMLDFSWFERR